MVGLNFLVQVPMLFSIAAANIRNLLSSLLVGVVVATFSLSGPVSAQSPERGTEYILGASDRIRIRMVAWDSTALAFTRFAEIEGEYTISSNGLLIIPLVGPIDAAGITPTELSEKITVFLQQSIGLAEEPSTTVEVAQYRPIYILGDVQRPGAYEYQPGLRVDQAVALAGGFSGADSLGSGAVRTAIRDDGVLREALIERVQLAVRAARLTAETSGANEIVLPEDLAHPDGEDALLESVQRETALFESRKESQQRALDSLDETKALLLREATALEEKLVGLETQLDLVATQIENTEGLVDRGLARSPALVALQSSRIDLESRQTDLETALFRAQQGATEIDRDRIDLETRRQETGLTELQAARSQLGRIATRIQMLADIRQEGQIALLDLSEGLEDVIVFSISRNNADIQVVQRDFQLSPLDVLEVATTPDDGLDEALAQ
jgi:protein involved in polysaccharide export with SLBB domain